MTVDVVNKVTVVESESRVQKWPAPNEVDSWSMLKAGCWNILKPDAVSSTSSLNSNFSNEVVHPSVEMPRKTTPASPQQKRLQKVQRARGRLTSNTGSRNDSNDDSEDYAWEWISPEIGPSEDGVNESGEDMFDEDSSPKKRRSKLLRNAARKGGKQHAAAAKKGDFKIALGDCVLIKAEGSHDPWFGIICEFLDDDVEDEKVAKFMWLVKQEDIHNGKSKRHDYFENELYMTSDFDYLPLETIDGKATIMSAKAFIAKYPTGKIPKKSSSLGPIYVCRRGCNSRTGTYTHEFIWEDIYNGPKDIHTLVEMVDNETKTRKKRKTLNRNREEDDYVAGEDIDIMETPRKKQKTYTVTTPRKPRTPSKLLTPSHKRVIVKKPLEFTPLGTRVLSPDHIYSPFQTARARLHVSSVPTSLPCREDEFASVYSHLNAAISDGFGACIYISGTPGTGKTATVREVIAQLNASVEAEELDDFIFVEINGMKVTDPHQSYSLLWEALKGQRVSPSHALDLLEREFNHPSPRRVPCVVLMDELDQLVTKNQSVMYNFFNWPGLRHSKIIVLAVANTMDLPERTLSNKISSRLGYTHEQLMKIIQSRLEGVPGNIVESDAVQFASRKVAAVSGDARRALDICRRAVELAEADSLNAPNTPSKKGANALQPSKSLGKVTIATVKRAINEATTSPLQQYLRSIPLSSKVLLASLLAKTRRTGIAESFLGEVIDEAKRMGTMDTGGNVVEFLLKNYQLAAKHRNTHLVMRQPLKAPRVLAMGASVIDLMEAGVIGLEARRADRTGKIRLSIGEEDLKLAFKDDPEIKSLGFSV
ncbi:hypothetical protein B7494_g2209 [Chlorociboria aeruginascens]|nr:hypothetical protein B7494_g2209 [Chlorociboria aeruginascens]